LIMKRWRVLVSLELEWRVFRFYNCIITSLVNRGVKLSSPILCFLSKRMDKHIIKVYSRKNLFEKQSGKIVVFYKYGQ
jgi:hypothetical protein